MGHSVSVSKLRDMLQAATPPVVIDVRREQAFAASGLAIVSARRVPPDRIEAAAPGFSGHTVVVYCVHGHEVSQGACAALRRHGIDAVFLQGGFDGWTESGLPVEPAGQGEQT